MCLLKNTIEELVYGDVGYEQYTVDYIDPGRMNYGYGT